MIAKPFSAPKPTGPRRLAGWEAEKQVAFYLDRAFSKREGFRLFHDLRLDHGGDVAQIDHLVLHPHGFALVESKSVRGTVTVDARDEWTRKSGKRAAEGMPSPIQQVKRQADVLQNLLDESKADLRRKTRIFGQHHFDAERFHLLVAIADAAIIDRRGCDPPELHKADHVTAAIQEAIDRQDRVNGFTGTVRFIKNPIKAPRYLNAFTAEETDNITAFLLASDTARAARAAPPARRSDDSVRPAPGATRTAEPPAEPRSVPAPPAPATPCTHLCTHCHGTDLEIRYGRNYYLGCRSCGKNTPLPYVCDRCSGPARPTKSGPEYRWKCEACGVGGVFFGFFGEVSG